MSRAGGRPHVVVIGGGLAGLVAARELRRRDVSVRVLEASHRTGGKAGADRTPHGDLLDHGYHVFPGWYANTLDLMRELGIADRLRPIDRVHYLRKGEFPMVRTLREMSSLANLRANLRSGLVPWHTAILCSFYGLDLATQRFERRAWLDRISANGFLRSRCYATEQVAETHQHFVLQASSIPNYELSAMTARRITQAWFRVPSPLFSILDRDLQSGLVQPLEDDVRRRGATIESGRRVLRLRLEGRDVRAAVLEDGSEAQADSFVLAVPHAAAFDLVDGDLAQAERAAPAEDGERPGLAGLAHLESAPMAALHVFFRRRLAGVPREHTVCFASPSQLSFVDLSQHWQGFGDRTVLSVIASDFTPLLKLPDPVAKRMLIDELAEYLHPLFDARDVDFARSHLRSNVEAPLFLNTVGAWQYRPGPRTRLPNLFVAGDWCRTTTDLTTMEGAVESGLSSAKALLEHHGLPADVAIARLDAPLHAGWRWARRALMPAMWLLSRLARAWSRSAGGERPGAPLSAAPSPPPRRSPRPPAGAESPSPPGR